MTRIPQPVETTPAQTPIAVSILAGGLSSRMGRDKATLRFWGKSLLSQVRAIARQTDWPTRVIERDLVSRCGPLGGIYTALKTSRAEAELFLACDMPFVSPALLARLACALSQKRNAVFTVSGKSAGFPFLIRTEALERIEYQIRRKTFSLQALAGVLESRLVRVRQEDEAQLFNINTPEDWSAALKLANRPKL